MSISIKRNRLKVLWLLALILGFAYERPLFLLTTLDRVNPRIYDVVMIVGVLVFWKDLFKPLRLPPPIRIWVVLVFWFSFCALIWSFFLLPFEYGKFSLFYAYRYLLGLLTIVLVLTTHLTEIDKRRVVECVIFGGFFVACYALNQFVNPSDYIPIAGEKVFVPFLNILTGPFGVTYFHIAQFSSLAFIFTLIYSQNLRTGLSRLLGLLVALFISWPLFFCGSRTALAYFFISVLILAVFSLRRFYRFMAPVLCVILFGAASLGINLNTILESENSATISRMVRASSNSHSNSVQNRFSNWSLDYSEYKYDGVLIPFIGAGFYVAPVSGNYRVGYGVHNNYLFSLEQSGLIGFVLFMLFFIQAIFLLNRIRLKEQGVDKWYALAMLVFMCSTAILNITGQVFVRGYNTNNLNTFLLSILAVAFVCTAKRVNKLHVS